MRTYTINFTTECGAVRCETVKALSMVDAIEKLRDRPELRLRLVHNIRRAYERERG